MVFLIKLIWTKIVKSVLKGLSARLCFLPDGKKKVPLPTIPSAGVVRPVADNQIKNTGHSLSRNFSCSNFDIANKKSRLVTSSMLYG